MGLLIIRHKVRDYPAWRKVFDAHNGVRTSAGLTNPRVFRSAEDASELVVLLDFKDAGSAKEFGASPDLKAKMADAGVVEAPTVFFLEPAG